MSRTSCPVYRPSAEEFASFQAFVASVEPEASKFGICKIVPPEGWWRSVQDVTELCDVAGPFGDTEIRGPTSQTVCGSRGVFEVHHVEQRTMTVRELHKRAAQAAQRFDDDECRRSLRGNQGSKEEQVARRFWQSLGSSGVASLYGADVPGLSLFERFPQKKTFGEEWFLDALPTDPLRLALRKAEAPRMPGVTESMIYVGAWRALFAWHVEDVNLFSVNLVHLGAPKSWYALPASEGSRFAKFAATLFPGAARACPNFLAHKMSIIAPDKLRANAFTVTECVQRAGEIMITFPAAYHCGFNHGFNLAESTNFANAGWPSFGREYVPCECQSDSVNIRVDDVAEAIQTGDFDKVVRNIPDVANDDDDGQSRHWPSSSPKQRRSSSSLLCEDDDDDLSDADEVVTRKKKSKATRVTKGAKKRPRCRVCAGCRAEECGECRFCLDMLRFGGPGKMKKPCKLRKCIAIAYPPCMS